MIGLLACGWATAAAAQQLDIRDYEAADPCDPYAVQLKVTIEGLDDSGGILTVDLYGNEPDRFLNKKGRIRRVRVPAGTGSQTICMTAPPPGSYAVATYHDQDGDRDLDKKWNLMPKEPFGLSNNPEPKFGWPKIAPSLFVIGEPGGVVSITLVEAD